MSAFQFSPVAQVTRDGSQSNHCRFTAWLLPPALLLLSPSLPSPCSSFFLLLVVERTKKCLDFTATLHLLHLFLSLVYGGPPVTATWWITVGSGMAGMTVLGEWLCMRREQRDIPLTAVARGPSERGGEEEQRGME